MIKGGEINHRLSLTYEIRKTDMSDKLKTVLIKTENGPVNINEVDYDPDVHELIDNAGSGDNADNSERDKLFEQAKNLGLKPHHNVGLEKLQTMIDEHNAGSGDGTASGDNAGSGETPTLSVSEVENDKYFIIDAENNKYEHNDVAAEGYDTAQAAWDAILQIGGDAANA